MMERVTIGIPTYNRPLGLKRTLDKILSQTYYNLEIIISDNCSPTNETEVLARELMSNDSRIKYFRQDSNKGIINNFYFVLSQASSNYFMWATDDDYFESPNLVERLMAYAPDNILTFTNYNFISDNEVVANFFTSVYGDCKNRLDYIIKLCRNGWGHPSCGMYNLRLLDHHRIKLKLEENLSYHMEGLLLHKLFDTGKVKYVDDVKINFSTRSREKSSIVITKRVNDFLKYSKQLIFFYLFKSNNTFKVKYRLVKILFKVQFNYYKALPNIVPTP